MSPHVASCFHPDDVDQPAAQGSFSFKCNQCCQFDKPEQAGVLSLKKGVKRHLNLKKGAVIIATIASFRITTITDTCDTKQATRQTDSDELDKMRSRNSGAANKLCTALRHEERKG
jgi:hypothetical protein